jgi:hypothetical protein
VGAAITAKDHILTTTHDMPESYFSYMIFEDLTLASDLFDGKVNSVASVGHGKVVIGGMIKDYTNTINDKVPLLGDIPLLGNFFKSKSTEVKKTNLLIFVTARVLKPNGMPYWASDSVGKPTSAGIGDLY